MFKQLSDRVLPLQCVDCGHGVKAVPYLDSYVIGYVSMTKCEKCDAPATFSGVNVSEYKKGCFPLISSGYFLV